jgi:hypothetical protein
MITLWSSYSEETPQEIIYKSQKLLYSSRQTTFEFDLLHGKQTAVFLNCPSK